MKIQSVLRLSLPGFLFLLLTAERCVEITDINAPNIVSPGSSFQVKTRLKHLSNPDNQTDFSLAYYLSYDRIWNPEDLSLGSTTLTGFQESETREVNQTFSLPVGTFMGRYYLIAKAKDGEMHRPLQVNGPVNIGVDLVPANLFTYGGDKAGDMFRFAFSLFNRGVQASEHSTVRCYFSKDIYVDAGDRMVYPLAISSSLSGNGIREFTGLEFEIPYDLPSGDYFFIVAADAGNTVNETVESNNSVSKLVSIGANLAGQAEDRSDMLDLSLPPSPTPAIALAPNPAGDYLNIAFQLPSPATVSLDILDLSGRTIESLGEQNMDAGAYSQRIDLAAWPSGTYLVRTRIDGQIVARQVVKN